MKKTFFILTTLLCSSLIVLATDNVVVPNLTITPGGQGRLDVQLNNERPYHTFGLILNLPTGINYVGLEKNTTRYVGYKDEFGNEQSNDHSLTGIPNEEGIRIASFAISLNPFAGNSGTLFSIIITADDSLTAGTELKGTLTNLLFSTDEQEYDDIPDVDFTITIGEPDDTRTVLDETSTTAPTSATNVDVRVKRTIKADEWSTICLPFAMTEAQVKEAFGDNVQLGEFNGVDYEFDGDDVVGITVNFTNTQSIEANHPYIIKVSQPVSEFTLDGVDIVADEDEAYIEFDNGKTGSRRVVYSGFYGTYHAQTVLDKFTLFLSDNKFWYSMGQTAMKAFRAYFDFLDKLTDVENASNIKLWVNNNDEDRLQSLSGSPIKGENTYNLAGQRVGKGYKGIVIESGKKTIK